MSKGPRGLRQLANNIIAGGIAQGLGFLTLAYILVRYPIDVYGKFAVANTIALIVSPVAAFRIELQSLRETDLLKAQALRSLSVAVAVGISILLGLAWAMTKGGGWDGAALSAAIFGYYAFSLVQMTCGVEGELNRVAGQRVLQGGGVLLATVALTELLGARSSTLLFATAFGFFVAVGRRIRFSGSGWRDAILKVKSEVGYQIRASSTSLLNSLSLWAFVPFIGFTYGPADAGQFNAISRLTAAPANMLVQAGSSLLLAGHRQGGAEPAFVKTEFRRNAAVAFAALPIAVAAQFLVLRVAGAKNLSFEDSSACWILLTLLVVAIAQSTVSPLIQLLLLSGRASAQLMLDAARALSVGSVLLVGWWFRFRLAELVSLFGLVQISYYTAALLICGSLSQRRATLA